MKIAVFWVIAMSSLAGVQDASEVLAASIIRSAELQMKKIY
jgi:hypothetical protein